MIKNIKSDELTGHHITKVLLTSRQIKRRVKELASEISKDYSGNKLVVVAVLKGSVIFFSDLLRSLQVNCSVDFISVSSYEGGNSSGVVRLLTDLKENPVNKDILLVEDIVDTGRTIAYLKKNLLTRQPNSLKICALLDKPSARKVKVKVDYQGFSVPDKFVVGYGLDYEEEFRGLPYIAVLDPKIYRKEK